MPQEAGHTDHSNVQLDLDDPGQIYLSLNDESVLHRIFNPHLPFDPALGLPEQLNGHTNGQPTNGHAPEEDSPIIRQSKDLEREGTEAADAGDHERAVVLFSSAINLTPQRSSIYNNRAQAYRLLHNIEGAVSDLDKAIELSDGQGATACQAYTQRATIRKLQDDETGALEDFKKAASLGGQFARAQVVAMNPYAALCGSAVAEMMQRARAGNSE